MFLKRKILNFIRKIIGINQLLDQLHNIKQELDSTRDELRYEMRFTKEGIDTSLDNTRDELKCEMLYTQQELEIKKDLIDSLHHTQKDLIDSLHHTKQELIDSLHHTQKDLINSLHHTKQELMDQQNNTKQELIGVKKILGSLKLPMKEINNKILIIIPTFRVGGAETCIINQKKILEKYNDKFEYYYIVHGSDILSNNNFFYLDFYDLNSIDIINNIINEMDITHIQIHIVDGEGCTLINQLLVLINSCYIYVPLVGVWVHSVFVEKNDLLKFKNMSYVSFTTKEIYNKYMDDTFNYFQTFLFPHVIANDTEYIKTNPEGYALLISRLDEDKRLSIESFIVFCVTNNIDFRIAGSTSYSKDFSEYIESTCQKHSFSSDKFIGNIDTINFLKQNGSQISFVAGLGQVVIEAGSLGYPVYISHVYGAENHVGFVTQKNFNSLLNTNFTGRNFPNVSFSQTLEELQYIHSDDKFNIKLLIEQNFSEQICVDLYRQIWNTKSK